MPKCRRDWQRRTLYLISVCFFIFEGVTIRHVQALPGPEHVIASTLPAQKVYITDTPTGASPSLEQIPPHADTLGDSSIYLVFALRPEHNNAPPQHDTENNSTADKQQVNAPSITDARRNHIPTYLAAIGITLIPFDQQLVEHLPRVDRTNCDNITRTINSFGTPGVIGPLIGGLYVLGDRYDRTTAEYITFALVNGGVVSESMKRLTGRARPDDIAEAGEFTGPDFNSQRISFPSGHTYAAFATATVLANRYPKMKYLCYILATSVGLARIRSSAHFPSDVLVGAGIGIAAGNAALDHRRLFAIEF